MKNNQQSNEEAQIQEDLSEVLQVRRDKLKNYKNQVEILLKKVDMIELIILWI